MALQLTFPEGGMLVTGGTGKVGGGIIRQLAKAGVPLVLTYQSNADKADALVRELTAQDARVWAQQMDMGDTGSIQAALDRVVAECGTIHGVACGSGPEVAFHKLMDFDMAAAEAFLNADALGYFRVFRTAAPMLRARGGGTLTTCSSMAAWRVLDFDGISGVSKAAVEALVRQVASEEAENGIRCNAVAIGWVEGERRWEDVWALTPKTKPAHPQTDMERIYALTHQISDAVRMRRVGLPEEAGNLFAFLASREASYITGQLIALDGGATL